MAAGHVVVPFRRSPAGRPVALGPVARPFSLGNPVGAGNAEPGAAPPTVPRMPQEHALLVSLTRSPNIHVSYVAFAARSGLELRDVLSDAADSGSCTPGGLWRCLRLSHHLGGLYDGNWRRPNGTPNRYMLRALLSDPHAGRLEEDAVDWVMRYSAYLSNSSSVARERQARMMDCVKDMPRSGLLGNPDPSRGPVESRRTVEEDLEYRDRHGPYAAAMLWQNVVVPDAASLRVYAAAARDLLDQLATEVVHMLSGVDNLAGARHPQKLKDLSVWAKGTIPALGRARSAWLSCVSCPDSDTRRSLADAWSQVRPDGSGPKLVGSALSYEPEPAIEWDGCLYAGTEPRAVSRLRDYLSLLDTELAPAFRSMSLGRMPDGATAGSMPDRLDEAAQAAASVSLGLTSWMGAARKKQLSLWR